MGFPFYWEYSIYAVYSNTLLSQHQYSVTTPTPVIHQARASSSGKKVNFPLIIQHTILPEVRLWWQKKKCQTKKKTSWCLSKEWVRNLKWLLVLGPAGDVRHGSIVSTKQETEIWQVMCWFSKRTSSFIVFITANRYDSMFAVSNFQLHNDPIIRLHIHVKCLVSI